MKIGRPQNPRMGIVEFLGNNCSHGANSPDCSADDQPAHMSPELSTGRMDPRGRVGSGRVTILPDLGGSGRVGSALRICKFFY